VVDHAEVEDWQRWWIYGGDVIVGGDVTDGSGGDVTDGSGVDGVLGRVGHRGDTGGVIGVVRAGGGSDGSDIGVRENCCGGSDNTSKNAFGGNNSTLERSRIDHACDDVRNNNITNNNDMEMR